MATILTGLLSFMLEETATTGSIDTRTDDKRRYAARSQFWNRDQKLFCDVSPELAAVKAVQPQPLVSPKKQPLSKAPASEPERSWGQLVAQYLRLLLGSLVVYVIAAKLASRLQSVLFP